MIDPDILKAELVILKQKEEDLVITLEEVRTSISVYQKDLEGVEET